MSILRYIIVINGKGLKVQNPTQWYNIDSLSKWADNPNEGDSGAIYQSIKRFGYNNAIAIKDGVIMGGNHRVYALSLLRDEGWLPSDCKHKSNFLKIDNKDWYVAGFDISDMNDEEVAAFALALNRTSRLGYDSPDALLNVLNMISQSDDKLLDAISYTSGDIEFLEDIVTKQRSISLPISHSRVLGDSKKQIKPVLYLEEVKTFEKAIKLTGEKNRGNAILKICAEYIENHE